MIKVKLLLAQNELFQLSGVLCQPHGNHKTKCYEQFCANKWDNLEEMDKFFETYNLPRLNQEEKENVNKLISTKEIES